MPGHRAATGGGAVAAACVLALGAGCATGSAESRNESLRGCRVRFRSCIDLCGTRLPQETAACVERCAEAANRCAGALETSSATMAARPDQVPGLWVAHYFGRPNLTGLQVARAEPAVALTSASESRFRSAASIRWTLRERMPGGSYRMLLQCDGKAVLRVDGALVPLHPAPELVTTAKVRSAAPLRSDPVALGGGRLVELEVVQAGTARQCLGTWMAVAGPAR